MQTTTLEQLELIKLANTPTPLWVVLYLYSKARKNCYPMYLEGAEMLVHWLTNGHTIPIELPPIPDDYTLPVLLDSNYEARELAKAIVGNVIDTDDLDKWLTDVAKVSYAIHEVMEQKVRNLL